MRCKPHVSRQMLNRRRVQKKNKTKTLKTAEKMYFSWASKNKHCVLQPHSYSLQLGNT